MRLDRSHTVLRKFLSMMCTLLIPIRFADGTHSKIAGSNWRRVIGCEYGSISWRWGEGDVGGWARQAAAILDSEISDRLRDRLKELGMEFWFNERPVKVENSASGATLHMKSGKKLETEAALFAAGRRAAVDGLALEKADSR